jgi:phosphotransferase system enzyme I (PtsI)
VTNARHGNEVVLHGIGVSPGVVTGPAFLMASEAIQFIERQIPESEVDREIARFESAIIETRRQIKLIQCELTRQASMDSGGILTAHLMVLDDNAIIEEIIDGICRRRINAEPVVKDVVGKYAAVLASMSDEYLRERVADVKDVARRVLRNLSGTTGISLSNMVQPQIVVSDDLAPSETAALRKENVAGFATNLGSATCHTAVLARALEIPAVVGMIDITSHVKAGDEILIDGNKGIVIICPTPERLEAYGRVAEERNSIAKELDALRLEPAETTDGHRITLSANTEGIEELNSVRQYGAEGVGLFRSEYLFLASTHMVDEDEQFAVYRRVAEGLKPAPVIIRTLDIGGDKFMPGAASRESNPFLGCRSIRLSLLHPEEFKKQLRAILRASAYGNVKIMYPMISRLSEVLRANELLEEAKQELALKKIAFQRDIDVGVMIEIPCAALMADTLARHVKFFSLGTNDLIQYTLAVDRRNERVASLYEPTHPAVLKLIHETVAAGHRHGIWVGVCGEMAADPLMTPLLVGFGVDELSVAPSAVPLVKDAVRSVSFARAKELAVLALGCQTGAEVLEHCRKLTSEVAPELLELV